MARQLIREWQEQDQVADPVLPGDRHLVKLLSQDNFHAYVTLHDGQVIGGLTAYELTMFDVEENEMFLYEIGVNEGFRRQGVAGKLIGALRQTCREKGIRVIFVGTEPDNEAAKRLYSMTGGDIKIIAWFTYNLEK